MMVIAGVIIAVRSPENVGAVMSICGSSMVLTAFFANVSRAV